MSAMTVQESIQSEREYQDAKWGHHSQHGHEVGAWLLLMQVHLTKAQQAWAGANNDKGALEELRKVLAIGVACAEQHGLPHRSAYMLGTVERQR
jgi:hypothetical protein